MAGRRLAWLLALAVTANAAALMPGLALTTPALVIGSARRTTFLLAQQQQDPNEQNLYYDHHGQPHGYNQQQQQQYEYEQQRLQHGYDQQDTIEQLPSPWQALVCQNSGKVYYSNPQTGEVMWSPPDHYASLATSYGFAECDSYGQKHLAIREQYERYRTQGGLLEFLKWQEMVSPAVPQRWRQKASDHRHDPSRRVQLPPLPQVAHGHY